MTIVSVVAMFLVGLSLFGLAFGAANYSPAALDRIRILSLVTLGLVVVFDFVLLVGTAIGWRMTRVAAAIAFIGAAVCFIVANLTPTRL